MFATLHAYLLFGVSSTILLVLLGLFVFGFRHHRGVPSFLAVIGAIACVCLSDWLELLGPSETWCVYWYATARTTAVCVAVASWVHFCLVYTNLDQATWSRYATLSAAAGSTAFSGIAWTPWRSLLVQDLQFTQHTWLWEPVQRIPGPLYRPYLAFAILCTVFGLALLTIYLYRTSLHSRIQVLFLVVGFGLPIGIETLNALEYLGSPSIDKLVFVLPITLSLLVFALYRHGLFVSTPVLLRGLMDHLPDAVVALDNNRYVTEANAPGLGLLRRHAQDTTTDGPILHRRPTDLLPANQPITDVFEKLEPGERIVHAMETGGKQTYVVRTSSLPHAQTATLVTFRNETERLQLMEDLQAYATTVAHDLRNPLTAILINCEVLLARRCASNQDSDAVQRENETLKQIHSDGKRMQAIVRDLLLVGSVERKESPELRCVDSHELISQIVERLNQELDIDIRWEGVENSVAVRGQPVWIDMILSNLVNNAVEHSGKSETQIRLRLDDEGEFLRFTVLNQGSKLTGEPFAPGNTGAGPANQRDPRTGTPRGFGLSIVRRLVERQGGSVGAESHGDETAIWFTLHKANGYDAKP